METKTSETCSNLTASDENSKQTEQALYGLLSI